MLAGLARLPNRPDLSNRANDLPADVKLKGGDASRRKAPIQYYKERIMETTVQNQECQEEPRILDEIQVEELAIDGICGVY